MYFSTNIIGVTTSRWISNGCGRNGDKKYRENFSQNTLRGKFEVQ